MLLAPLVSERGLDPGTALSSLAGFTVLAMDIDLDGAEAFGGRTGDFGSGFGIPSEPCVEALSAVPGREDTVVVDLDALLTCLFCEPMSLGGKAGLAFLDGCSATTSNGLFFGMFFGIGGIDWLVLK